MNKNFLIGIEYIRPVCIKSEAGEDPEFIWIATHKDYNWFCGYGQDSDAAINHLEALIAIIEENDRKKNRNDQTYFSFKAELQEDK